MAYCSIGVHSCGKMERWNARVLLQLSQTGWKNCPYNRWVRVLVSVQIINVFVVHYCLAFLKSLADLNS